MFLCLCLQCNLHGIATQQRYHPHMLPSPTLLQGLKVRDGIFSERILVSEGWVGLHAAYLNEHNGKNHALSNRHKVCALASLASRMGNTLFDQRDAGGYMLALLEQCMLVFITECLEGNLVWASVRQDMVGLEQLLDPDAPRGVQHVGQVVVLRLHSPRRQPTRRRQQTPPALASASRRLDSKSEDAAAQHDPGEKLP